MVLGQSLTDAPGTRHAMAGLLPVETSFAERRMHIGYRRLNLRQDLPLGPRGTAFRGHEFHFASVVREPAEAPLFEAREAPDDAPRPMGAVAGRVFGSFAHLIHLDHVS